MTETDTDLVTLTAEVAAAYFDNNTVEIDDIGRVISGIHQALAAIGKPSVEEEGPTEDRQTPAQIRKSISPDHLISFIDGRKFKTLKRHLSLHGMTPADYRDYYGLPSDYPMVAPNYSAARSSLAVAAGLGQGGRKPKGASKGRKTA